MHHNKIQLKLKSLEKDYKKLKEKLENAPLLKSKKDVYLKEDKESFKKLWNEYIIFFDRLKKLLRASAYRKYFLKINYNKLVLRKYIVHFYFGILGDILNNFGKHETFMRVFLDENFVKDYGYYAKYIYSPRFINIYNTPKIFIDPFRSFIDSNVFDLFKNIKDLGSIKGIRTDYNNIFYYIKYRVDKILFFLSKHIGYRISHTKFSSRKYGLITKENLERYLLVAKPGDIFLSRGNWHASNASIPGFWKHMSLYLGTGNYLKKHYKKLCPFEVEDTKHYIIEATGDGVKIANIFDFISHIDYLGVSRTNFHKEKIERSIANSLSHIGKGYDHIFNYYSDNRLVCSSLVMKSYAKETRDDEGIDIELEHMAISLTFPPTKFISILIEEAKKETPSIFPLFFIDSLEKTGENFVSTPEELLKTIHRPRLSIFLK